VSDANGWNPWTLDDTDTKRQRYTKSDVHRGQTELIQCRADSFHVRRIDEIVASRIDAVLKTRSDVIQDAIALWLEDWDRKFPDGSGGELGYHARLLRIERKRIYRDQFMETAEEQLNALQADGDIHGLAEFLQIILQSQGDFKDDAPVSFMDQLEKLVDRAHRLVEAAR
jgi:Arc/MetJ-type ribon-helix-helix transcriptional regulator